MATSMKELAEWCDNGIRKLGKEPSTYTSPKDWSSHEANVTRTLKTYQSMRNNPQVDSKLYLKFYLDAVAHAAKDANTAAQEGFLQAHEANVRNILVGDFAAISASAQTPAARPQAAPLESTSGILHTIGEGFGNTAKGLANAAEEIVNETFKGGGELYGKATRAIGQQDAEVVDFQRSEAFKNVINYRDQLQKEPQDDLTKAKVDALNGIIDKINTAPCMKNIEDTLNSLKKGNKDYDTLAQGRKSGFTGGFLTNVLGVKSTSVGLIEDLKNSLPNPESSASYSPRR